MRLLLALGLAVSLVGCGEKTTAEQCEDLLSRLEAEVETLPVACRRDADCQTVELQCYEFVSTSAAELPQSVTRLASRYRELDCCPEDFDPAAPPPIPQAECGDAEDGGRACGVLIKSR